MTESKNTTEAMQALIDTMKALAAHNRTARAAAFIDFATAFRVQTEAFTESIADGRSSADAAGYAEQIAALEARHARDERTEQRQFTEVVLHSALQATGLTVIAQGPGLVSKTLGALGDQTLTVRFADHERFRTFLDEAHDAWPRVGQEEPFRVALTETATQATVDGIRLLAQHAAIGRGLGTEARAIASGLRDLGIHAPVIRLLDTVAAHARAGTLPLFARASEAGLLSRPRESPLGRSPVDSDHGELILTWLPALAAIAEARGTAMEEPLRRHGSEHFRFAQRVWQRERGADLEPRTREIDLAFRFVGRELEARGVSLEGPLDFSLL